jgi:hypothetical protein
MNRRDFLKVGGLFSAALLFQSSSFGTIAPLVIEAQAGGKLYRAADGKILISHDSGGTWQLHTNFGSIIDVLDLSVNTQGQLFAQLGFQGHRFELALAQDGMNIWRTV